MEWKNGKLQLPQVTLAARLTNADILVIGVAHGADDRTGPHLVPGQHCGLRLEAGVGGDIAVMMVNDHRGAQKAILRNRKDGACGSRRHRRTRCRLDIHSVMGTPIPQGLIIGEGIHREHRHRLANDRGDHLQRLLRRGTYFLRYRGRGLRLPGIHRLGRLHHHRLVGNHRLGRFLLRYVHGHTAAGILLVHRLDLILLGLCFIA